VRIINRLEPLVSAMERDEYNHRNFQLAQIFSEQVRLAKKERRLVGMEEDSEKDLYKTEVYDLKDMRYFTG